MSVSYTSALDRRLLGNVDIRRLHARQLLLPVTSLVAMLAIGLAYGGTTRTLPARGSTQGSARVTNLNTVADARELEPALESLFASAADRLVAARALFDHVAAIRGGGNAISNVGTLAAATTPTKTPVLTATELARLKPSFVVRTADTFERLTLVYAAVYLASFYFVLLIWRLAGIRGDSLLLATAHLLTAVGFAVLLTRPDPLRDTMLVVRYTHGVLLGLAVMAVVSVLDFRKAAFLRFSYIPLAVALLLSVILVLFGHGPGNSTAKVNLGPVQPIEAIRLLLALFLAGYFARRWELLRQVRGNTIGRYHVPRWFHLPRADYVLPVLTGVGAALLLFFLQKDLGPALFLSCVFLAMYAVARARIVMALGGFGLLIAGLYVGFRLHVSETLANRVAMWQSPWDNAVRGGDQIAQSIWALSTGGLVGVGLGFGNTRYVPAGYTDLALATVGEELGAAGLLVIAAVYVVLTVRGLRIGLRASNDYGFFLATAITLFLIVPVIVMAAGMLGVTPLTGVVTPFLSYGGSAMVANFAALGMLMSIHRQTESIEPSEPFRTPIRYLGGALAIAAVGLMALVVDVQVLHADDYVAKPHRSLQGDGVRRYQYNQRVLDVARLIRRGTIYDRTGLPLATSDTAVMLKSRDALDNVVRRNPTCVEPIERCYPFGGTAFHLLGDVARLNWSATNTSYIERDAESRLRGFQDHRELIPLLRHRYDLEHPAARRLLGREHDLRLTVDARFQLRVATILSHYAEKSASGKAAAIVIDARTGDLLASASYPWPQIGSETVSSTREGDDLLDRARYGLYPPGSTFKLVTAAAALRRDIAWSNRTFVCSLLPDGRVGARVPGWTRPVRDDVLYKHPHGRIGMHDGIVQSCNAYFAQLALNLGPEPILDAATRLGILVAPANAPQRLRASLPHAGYGQGAVVATPLRMARVAAAIANGGVLRDVRLELDSSVASDTEILLPADRAALLARYMRDAVVSGSGRRLANNPWRIAGKTGTGEVSGELSHAWFVGFAPYGSTSRQIAFAVIIEQAGYGGLAAAPAAGEIVSAAAAAGLIQ